MYIQLFRFGERKMPVKEYKVGIIGFGTVGAGVAENLLANADAIAQRTGVRPALIESNSFAIFFSIVVFFLFVIIRSRTLCSNARMLPQGFRQR